MLNLIGKAITGVMLTREAREAVREAGGLASAIQSSADARLIKAALMAQGMQLASAQASTQYGSAQTGMAQIGSTPLTSPRAATALKSIPMAVRLAMASKPAAQSAPVADPLPIVAAAPSIPTPIPDANDRIVPSDFVSARNREAVSPERAALLKKAMKLHTEKQTVLAHLTDEQRAMLTAIATKALFPQAAE